MKTKFFINLLAVLVIATSCKNDNKEEKAVPAGKQFFSVEEDIVAETMDDFAVYYTETGKNDFIPTQVVWKGVKGGLVKETVSFDLPEQIIPTNIRLDFGVKKERKDVVLERLKLSYYDKTFEIKGSEFLNYFIVNPAVPTEVDAAKGTIKLIKDPKNQEGTYFYPRQELLDQLAKMTK
ncbi:MAG TPA: hypothetical protein VK476_03905 [Flavobacterium sp.]|nr:hypothetical protein [Flavobacterium sp.]